MRTIRSVVGRLVASPVLLLLLACYALQVGLTSPIDQHGLRAILGIFDGIGLLGLSYLETETDEG